MDILEQLSSAVSDPTQGANTAAAQRCLDPIEGPALLERIASGLGARSASLAGDCAEVLTQVAEVSPARVAPFARFLLEQLGHKSARVRWESAHALALIAGCVPALIARELPALATIVRSDPSVIVRDYLLDAVAAHAATGEAQARAALPLLREGLALYAGKHAARILRGLLAVAASCPALHDEIRAMAEPLGADPRPGVRKAAAALLRARR